MLIESLITEYNPLRKFRKSNVFCGLIIFFGKCTASYLELRTVSRVILKPSFLQFLLSVQSN